MKKLRANPPVLYLQIYIVYTDEDSNDHKNDKNHADQTGLGKFPNVTIINGFYFILDRYEAKFVAKNHLKFGVFRSFLVILKYFCMNLSVKT